MSPDMNEPYDYLVIGSGMAGLAVSSLLAKAGHSVCLLEAHEHAGGCAHSFPMSRYTFCAAVHYIFYGGQGEPVANLLKKLGLETEVTLSRLDPEGYDRFSCPSQNLRFSIPNGLDKWADRLIDRLPQERWKILNFFRVIQRIAENLQKFPVERDWRFFLKAPLSSKTLLRYRRWTLQRLFDKLELSQQAQAILATQVGDLGLPPDSVSLLIYAALIRAYGSGAYHPDGHYKQLVDALIKVVQNSPAGSVHFETEVSQINTDGDRVTSVETADGRRFSGRTVIANLDPKTCAGMIGWDQFPKSFRRKLVYSYSVSSYTVYLGLKGLDLRDYGFGNWNVWHYPHLDINRAYRTQIAENDFRDPWLFMSTPTLYAGAQQGAVCPEGDQILELVTVCSYDAYQRLRDDDVRGYRRKKKAITTAILDVVERHYVPNLRNHIAICVSGSPATNRRYLWAPGGNIYGSELNPANVDFGRLGFRTPWQNLYFAGASSAFPSVGATLAAGSKLYTLLTGDPVNPGRDLWGVW